MTADEAGGTLAAISLATAEYLWGKAEDESRRAGHPLTPTNSVPWSDLSDDERVQAATLLANYGVRAVMMMMCALAFARTSANIAMPGA